MSAQPVVIRSEEDAYALLEKILNETVSLDGVQLRLEGWPKLSIYLTGDKFHQTLTPSVMKGFIDLQAGIYKSYALAIHQNPDTRCLTKEERDDLEIEVKVGDGSTDIEIDLTDVLLGLINKMAGMDPVYVTTMVLGIGTLIAGSSALRHYLNHRKEVRTAELDQQTNKEMAEVQKETLKALQFSSAQETERARIISGLAQRHPMLAEIRDAAHDIKTSMIKSTSQASTIKVDGIELTGDIAHELTVNARRASEVVRLDGRYRVVRVDSDNLEELKVRVRNVTSGDVFEATVQDLSLSHSNREALEQALFDRTEVDLEVNAKSLNGEIKNAIILDAKATTPRQRQPSQ